MTAGGTATSYRYAGAQLAAEIAGGVYLRSHVSGQGTDEQWMSFEGPLTNPTPAPTWYQQDRQSSVIGVSDASGAITPYTYGPYGEPQSWSGSRFRYTGQIAIPEAQLYHYRARAYDPVMGRFLQTDPIGYDDGPNIYAYVGGDPVNGSDPSGTLGADWDQFHLGFGSVLRGIGDFFRGTGGTRTRDSFPGGDHAGQVFVPIPSFTFFDPACQCEGLGGGGRWVNDDSAAATQAWFGRVTDQQTRDGGWMFAIPALAPVAVVVGAEALGVAGIEAAVSGTALVGGPLTVADLAATLPAGVTLSEFGGLAGFAQGLSASSRASTVASAATIAGLKAANVSSDAIRVFQQFYTNVAATNPGNLSAVHRAALLSNILSGY